MAKIIDFNSYKKDEQDDEIKETKSPKTFSYPAYKLSVNCKNPYVYEICYRYGVCGRKFDEDGKLI